MEPTWGFPLTRACLNFNNDTTDISLKEISVSEICLSVELAHVLIIAVVLTWQKEEACACVKSLPPPARVSRYTASNGSVIRGLDFHAAPG